MAPAATSCRTSNARHSEQCEEPLYFVVAFVTTPRADKSADLAQDERLLSQSPSPAAACSPVCLPANRTNPHGSEVSILKTASLCASRCNALPLPVLREHSSSEVPAGIYSLPLRQLGLAAQPDGPRHGDLDLVAVAYNEDGVA
jgi:hypothetical protein